MLNRTYSQYTGTKLQAFPRLTNLLKSYSRNEIPKQAPVFEPAQIESFLSDSTGKSNTHIYHPHFQVNLKNAPRLFHA